MADEADGDKVGGAIEELLARLHERNRRLMEENLALRRLAYRDPLTGLRNRRFFDERLAEEHARAARDASYVFSVLVFDVDGFKLINDRLGHARGDEVLVQIARFLDDALRGYDVCCRIGGDEFAAVLPGANSEAGARAVARLQRRALRELGGLRISVGRASWPLDAPHLLGAADEAMYCDKRRAHRTRDNADDDQRSVVAGLRQLRATGQKPTWRQ